MRALSFATSWLIGSPSSQAFKIELTETLRKAGSRYHGMAMFSRKT
eukprot:CAMPEP_0183423704 /NCGR_PEP_ID=MMETSP0370-20130417/28667_1 /TAXON_ID=268820 /ORGANISM="Peridinium aciculiferum, Strain PAER-2" /LENGTH=45 /DNA_ID= /DNA_START= /DNA_END= /DNA_ORIENTATION=